MGQLVKAAGQRFDYRSFPEMGHHLHGLDPKLYVATIQEWVAEIHSSPNVAT